MGRIIMMNHYITPDNKTFGFNENQTDLIPDGAVLIPNSYNVDQIPYISLVDGNIVFNENQYNADLKNAQNESEIKTSALAKLAALGLTQDEIKALVG
jgi:hypothetical protein